MKLCVFFGHRSCPDHLYPLLENVIEQLIVQQQADTFYVGCTGNFDALVLCALRTLKTTYPHITYSVVLAYPPQKRSVFGSWITDEETIYPEILESTPPRYAISRRNRWLIKQAQTVVTYVNVPFGGAAQFKEMAEKAGKHVINLSERMA